MEFFISSVVTGYEEYRDAAKRAVEHLGHTASRIEDEPSLASPPGGPQRACMDAVRACDAVVLLLGERYGDTQKGSNKSATHEEWAEARRIEKPVLAFVEADVSPREEAQDRFVAEVSNWEHGCKWASYGSPDDVFREVLRALAKFIADPTLSSKGWRRLRQVDQDSRRAARRSVSDGQTVLRFDRAVARAAFAAVLQDSGKDLIVSGESGVGKSALVLDATETPSLPEESEVLALNLRHLPETSVELTAALSEPLEDLLAYMGAPRRSLVIDAAEACSENRAEVFAHVLAAARRSGIRVVAVTASDGFDAVRDAMSCDGADVERHAVPLLSDAEVSEAVERFPVLDRFADHARARELLRLPIMIDLLVRTSPSGAVLSAAEALQCVWQEFVCNAGRRDAGAPDASEGVMLQLAEHALTQGPPEELLSGLDLVAVASLRRSGLLRPSSPLPWERVPTFSHDLIRTYAVARWLLTDADPATALRDVDAPRWALPAARLACEVLLANRDDSSTNVFGRLQARFDALADDGLGERWADVPVEALLCASEPLQQLKAAWPTLIRANTKGVRRVLRIMRLRHQDVSTSSGAATPVPCAPYGLFSHRPNPMALDAFVADAVVQQLLDGGLPQGLEKQAAELISDWLFSHAMQQTPAGHPTRLALVAGIVEQCRERESQAQAALDEAAAQQESPDSSQPERPGRLPARAMLRPQRRRPDHVTPYQWINQVSIGHLGLLGADLGAEAETILRRVAEEAPDLLQHAVDPPGCGLALAQFSPGLLVRLTEAYYIVDHQAFDDDYRFSRRDEFVREHVFVGLGVPPTSYCRGPFLAMLQADYSGGVECINRLLNQAARHWARTRIYRGFVPRPDADVSEHTHELSITGVARPYVGDAQVWTWYRNDVTGYESCVSALKALEYAIDKRIQAGAQPAQIADELLDGAESLAMVALVFGILVRHLETAAEALDPFLAEPLIWHLEASRAAHERTGMSSPDPPGLVNTDRRTWNLKHVATMMVTYAALDRGANGQHRVAPLRHVGQRLLANAMAAISEDTPPDERRLQEAKARDWAEALDLDCYDFAAHDGDVAVQQKSSPELEPILDQARADSDRLNSESGLLLRHTRRIGEGCVPDTTPEQLAEDIATARDLLSDTSHWTHSTLEAAAGVAASALEANFGHRQAVHGSDLQWSADALLKVAAAAQSHETDAAFLFGPLLDMGPGCSAARGLPYLLLPEALSLRSDLDLDSRHGFRRLIAASGALAAHPTVVARLAYARSLDRIWASPCSSGLPMRCHHKVALKIARRSLQGCVAEHGRSEGSRARSQSRIKRTGILARFEGERIVPHGLLAAIRALGVAATSDACCRGAAQRDLTVLLDAFRRALAVHEFGFDSSDSCSLVAARAALQQAADGRSSVLLEHVLESMSNPRVLAVTLRAVAAAAEEHDALAAAARGHWPQVMDAVMDKARTSGVLTGDRDGCQARAELIPNPARDWPYQTRELPDEPRSWADLLAWSPQVERWLATAPGTRESIDQLVIAVRELAVEDQVDTGLRWIETLVQTTGAGRGSTFTLAEWLHERRSDLTTPEQEAMWRRVLDTQVVAGNTQVSRLAD